MTHLDEGTIHAWLDGALDAAHAAEVSRHAASCAECGALVAEARGFIAGASRILTSLDDAPAGVIPKRAPAIASAKPPRRAWQAAPWVTGIAAALILAIGVKEWRERPSAKAAFLPVPDAPALSEANVTADSLRAALSRQLSERAQDSNAARPLQTIQPLSAPPAPAAPARARQDAALDAVATTAGAGAGGSGARVVVGSDSSGDLKKANVAEAPEAATALTPDTSAQRMERRAFALPSPELRLAGCYRLAATALPSAASGEKAAALVATAPTAVRTQARKQAPAAAMAASPAPVAADMLPSPFLRLDTANSAQGRMVLSATTGDSVGTWRAVVGDSVRVVLFVGGTQTLPLSYRIACPTAP